MKTEERPRERVFFLICAAALALVGMTSACRGPDPPALEESPVEQTNADASREKADEPKEGTAPDATALSQDLLHARLMALRWSPENEAQLPDIAVPPETRVHGFRFQNGKQRAAVFLYEYPRAGFARAHARAIQRSHGVYQDGERLVVVEAYDKEIADELIDELSAVWRGPTEPPVGAK